MVGDGKMRVVVVSLPAQGHLNSLLQFSRAIAQRGASVSFVTTSTHIHQVQGRVQGWDLHKFDIRFEELPMPQLSAEESDVQSTNLFPLHLIPLFEDVEDQLGCHVDQLLQTICSENENRVIVVYDSCMGWIQSWATKYSIPAYVFRPTGAYFNLWIKRVCDRTWDNGSPHINVSLKRCFPERLIKYLRRQRSLSALAKGCIINTFSAVESEFIHHGSEELVYDGKPVWTAGPLLPHEFLNDEHDARLQSECMRWLDTQAPASVLYVSFGSLSSLSATQIRELADGLERSGQAFLWVLRISDGADVSRQVQFELACKFMEEGYAKRLEGRCFIVKDWAPQLDILFHKSTGGFLTHCGWNSTMESISAGIGMLAWPLHTDQFANAALVTRELRAGVEVKEWGSAEENEMVSAVEIEKAVKRLMRSEEGMQVRKRAQELKGEAGKAVGEGGSSWKDMDSLLHHMISQSFSIVF